MADVLNLIGDAWVSGDGPDVTILDKYSGQPLSVLRPASPVQVEAAVTSAEAAQRGSQLTSLDRYELLNRTADRVVSAAESLIAIVMADTGFVHADAANEVARTIETLRLSAEAARRTGIGEMVPMDAAPGGRGRIGFTLRFPVGVVGAITPFNSPLNTVAHKVAPALAAGNAVVLKPANTTPLSANALAEQLLAAGLPEGLLQVVHGEGPTVGQALLDDQRIDFYTLTGSTSVGRIVARAAGLRRTQLELGSIASTVVCDDADIGAAVPKIIGAGLRKAGQVCTSVQRLYVSDAVFADVVDALSAAMAAIRYGDPADAATGVGPLIAPREAGRVAKWVSDARAKGAKVVLGGERLGAVMAPTLLTSVDDEMDVMSREIFGPVICVVPFDDLGIAVERANATPYGLAAGIFTRDLARAMWAARTLRFGVVHVNEASSSRMDLMPFGGVKDSGHGKEGPLYAALEMTEERLVTVTPGAPTLSSSAGWS